MYTHGVTCFSCHDVHGTENNADLLKPANVLCLECHGPNSPNGPRAPTIEAHTHHKAGSARQMSASPVTCPRSSRRSPMSTCAAHTFKFITPSDTERLKVPNPCAGCHTNETTNWAADALKTWTNVSPWRVAAE